MAPDERVGADSMSEYEGQRKNVHTLPRLSTSSRCELA
jgi:hypothetical protein